MEELLGEMESYAALNHVPIINERGRAAFLQVVKEVRPHRVLEIGTAIGYSSLLFALHGAEDVEITTLELSEERINLAQSYINRSAYADRIRIMAGDAAENLLRLQLTGQKFDFVFIDAAK
ncbi:MAG: class I SAM-dependent methyltransferase, partial [Selenomonas sp.]|nr:class I SAM-dependent methyltransferase [Selenomonas sp.]